MPRSPTGEFTLVLPPVISGATIEADWANQTLADIATTLTDSTSRTAQGSMQAPLKLVDGTKSAPGLSFVNEANTGFYRPDAGDLHLSVLGVDYMRWTDDNGVQVSTDGSTWSTVTTALTLADQEVTAASWAGNTLTLVKASGDLTVDIDTLDALTVNTTLDVTGYATVGGLGVAGEVNQISSLVTLSTVNTSIANRFLLTNNGTINLTITKPTGVRDIGSDYTIEGNIIVSNGATPGVVSIAGAAAGDVLGSNSLVANAKSLLSYIIHNRGGVYTEIYIWTAVTS